MENSFYKKNDETVDVGSEVLDLCWNPEGNKLGSVTLDSNVNVWAVDEQNFEQDGIGTLSLFKSWSGKMDVLGGRLRDSVRTAKNSTDQKYYKTIDWSVDGRFVICGGNSKYIVIYDSESALMIRKIQTSKDVKLSGVKDKLDSRDIFFNGFSI